MTLTPSKKTIFDKLISFIQDQDKEIFILKGYAGTGKTTMIKELVSYLDGQEIKTLVMAPTGRAAKVLRDKVGKGVTIHRGIYNFDNLICLEEKSEDVSMKSFRYVFPVHNAMSNDSNFATVVIVDESSMISDTESEGEFFTFGSGKLLSDLLEYRANVGVKKMIFVGDDAQLPPVTDSRSYALDEQYGSRFGFVEDCYVHGSLLDQYDIHNDCSVDAGIVYTGDAKWKVYYLKKN